MLFVFANKTTTAANAILLQYSAPIFTAIFAAWLLKEKPKTEHLIAFPFVAGGMLLLLKGSWEQVIAGMDSYSTVLGYPLALGAAATLVLAVGLLVGVVVDLRRGEPLPHGSDAETSVE